jgi:hypothetical protein
VFPDYLPRKLIMIVKQSTPCLIAGCSRAARRIDDIGKQNGGQNALKIG